MGDTIKTVLLVKSLKAFSPLSCELYCTVFAMAKIRRIGHDHQAPFLLFFFLLDFKRSHKAKTSCHMINIP